MMMKLIINYSTILITFVCIGLLSCNKDCIENHKKDSGCLMYYEPVCGCNGKTYGNSCEAMNAGVRIESEGVCPQ